MSISDLLLIMSASLRPIGMGILVAVVSTVLLLLFLLAYCRGVWVEDKRFAVAGFFIGMTKRGSIRLACAWLKLILIITYVILFEKLVLTQYLMILFPAVIYIAFNSRPQKMFSDLLWFALQAVGLFCTNMICGYYHDMLAGSGFLLVYIAMGIFISLFSLYIFFVELMSISEQRTMNPRELWKQKVTIEEEAV